ncbi:MAG TPA: autotransporter assembly complex family protein [Burkholderiales bacterium]
MPASFLHRALVAAALHLGLLLPAPVLAALALEVTVVGVDGAVRDNVLATLTIYEERERSDLTAARVRRLHANALEQIRSALQPFGYYRPRIKATLAQEGDRWHARYEIDPGPAVPVTAVEVNVTGEGADDPAFRALVDGFPMAPGQTLDHAAYEEGRRRFEAVAAERGYFDMRFTRREIRLDLEAYRAQIFLDVDTGPRYRFGEVHIEQDLLSEELLRRYVHLTPGQPYSTAALLELQTAFSSTNYFRDVQVEADPREAIDHTVPVRVTLTPRKRDRYSFGVGYGTDTGPRGQASWQRFYVNEYGHHARVDLRASDIEQSLLAGYFIPIRNPQTDQLALTGGYEEIETTTAISRIRRAAIARTTVRGRTFETLSLAYQREAFEVGAQADTTTLLLPGASWTRYWGADRVYTRSGARLTLDLRGASEELGSDVSMLQARLSGKLILPVAMSGRLLTRFDVGTTRTEEFERVPASLRFFAGGDVSVRGYRYSSLGPTDASGDVVGGPRLLVGSVEYEQTIRGSWAVAAFYDIGNAVEDFSDPLVRGVGIGLRWRSPIGQIRLDAAHALDLPGDAWRIHLYIGPDL